MRSFLAVGLLAKTGLATGALRYELALLDPVYPEHPAQTYTVVLELNAQGFPDQYRLLLQTGVCLDQTCKRLSVTLFWDALGKYLRMEYPENIPLTKNDHEEFSQQDYDQLEAIMHDRGSILGVYPLADFIGHRAVSAVDVDAVSSATLTEVRHAVVPGAAYTSWVLWHRANGEIPEHLRALTLKHSSVDYLLHCLRSSDPRFSQFAVRCFEEMLGLSPQIVKQLADQLVFISSYSGVQAVLNILEKYGLDDPDVRKGVEKLLDSENRFIVRRAVEALSRVSEKVE